MEGKCVLEMVEKIKYDYSGEAGLRPTLCRNLILSVLSDNVNVQGPWAFLIGQVRASSEIYPFINVDLLNIIRTF